MAQPGWYLHEMSKHVGNIALNEVEIYVLKMCTSEETRGFWWSATLLFLNGMMLKFDILDRIIPQESRVEAMHKSWAVRGFTIDKAMLLH